MNFTSEFCCVLTQNSENMKGDNVTYPSSFRSPLPGKGYMRRRWNVRDFPQLNHLNLRLQ